MATPTDTRPPAQWLTANAEFYDYRTASNPVIDGTVQPIPGTQFGAELHQQKLSGTLPLDTSSLLGCVGPATSPGLCANFIHICPGDVQITAPNATS